jgi:hypothetical protein
MMRRTWSPARIASRICTTCSGEARLVEPGGQADAEQGEYQAEQRAEVFEQHDRKLRLLAVPHELPPGGASLAPARLPDREPERAALEHDRDAENRDRDDRLSELVWVQELLYALVDREQPPEREEHERDDEGPEVALAPEAEGVGVGGLAPGRGAAPEQECLVARVGDRVQGLGQHRGGARERVADPLGQGDAQVRRHRGEDRAPIPRIHRQLDLATVATAYLRRGARRRVSARGRQQVRVSARGQREGAPQLPL